MFYSLIKFLVDLELMFIFCTTGAHDILGLWFYLWIVVYTVSFVPARSSFTSSSTEQFLLWDENESGDITY